ncbi:unnamed protein product [Euphydryas editha]|uniref:Uncharacterized protein n=1 Tax=Euphydryas editha TaxID=104508 RepID=A0AAU9UTM2_EUPED|nr:unnamed protein product [Euphydryas editha]
MEEKSGLFAEASLSLEGSCCLQIRDPPIKAAEGSRRVQNTLKYLLNFGNVSHYLGYSALTDFFPTMSLKPNPQCDDSYCRRRQTEFKAKPVVELATEVKEDDTPIHADNEWGISLVDENSPEEETSNLKLAEGVEVAYSIPVDNNTPETSSGGAVAASELSLEELMQQMKSM